MRERFSSPATMRSTAPVKSSIAIETARLLSENHARTKELARANQELFASEVIPALRDYEPF